MLLKLRLKVWGRYEIPLLAPSHGAGQVSTVPIRFGSGHACLNGVVWGHQAIGVTRVSLCSLADRTADALERVSNPVWCLDYAI